ncbi:LytTR family DNA-binding domain-containing protein [Yoonia sp. 2307UL14-13]|uniref:LytTR family DNA-binding domain-containing protein n=1 Tax=Yoonia sp. 2307UL14-13 TaxID=3126506 RepID=UPI00309AC438
MLFAGDPNDVRAVHGAPFAVFIWTTSILAYTSVVFLVIGLLAMLQTALPRLPLYTPITSALGLLAVFVLARGLIVVFTGMEHRESAFPLYFNVLVTGLTLETLFIRFVLQGTGQDTEAEEEAAPRLLNIGDRSVPLSRVRYLHAQEHYIRIGLPNDTIMIRGRMRDALAQVDAADGFQPHRSWWISAAAQPRLIQTNGKPQVKLDDDTEVPVAKARAADIQRWLDHNKDW